MSAKTRHTRHFPCPRCHSYDEAPRGKGIRCSGFTVGEWTHCSRDELAGTLPQEAGGTYCHRMEGNCRCGLEHNGYRPTPISIGRSARTKASNAPEGRVVATHEYRDDDGELGYQVLKFEPKDFRQRRPDGHGGWVWSLEGVKRLLYRQPELIASTDTTVYYSTSEKDVDRLISVGLTATCNSEGDGKWQNHFVPYFAGLDVVFLCHNDPSGIAYGDQVAAALCGFARSVKVVRLPGLTEHGDVSDWLDAGHSVEDIEQLVDVWPDWHPATSPNDSAIADAFASIERDLAAAQAQLIERDRRIVELTSRLELSVSNETSRRHLLDAIATVCASKSVNPVLKPTAIALTIAGQHNPRFNGVYETPHRIYRDQVCDLAGIINPDTASKHLKALDDENFLTLTEEPLPMREIIGRDGKVKRYRPMALAVQLGPRPGEEAITAEMRLKMLAAPKKAEVQRKNWGGKREKQDPPRCDQHPTSDVRADWYCVEGGEFLRADVVRPEQQDAVSVPEPVESPKPHLAAPVIGEVPQDAVLVCDHGVLPRGASCGPCLVRSCLECGKHTGSIIRSVCLVDCRGRPDAPTVYLRAPEELIAAYGSVGAAG